MILNLFSADPQHPLADAKELKRVLGELPADNSFKAVDEIVGWLESLQHAENFRADRLNEVVRQLDEAAQIHIRRLARDYLTSPRLSKTDERHFSTASLDFWSRLAAVHELALAAVAAKDKGADALKPLLPLITSRLLGALGAVFKWTHFKYGPLDRDLWRRLGAAYLAAERGGYVHKPVQLYPGVPTVTTPAHEYLRLLVLAASSLNSLLPVEIELADKLIVHFLPHFAVSATDRPDNLYWIDVAVGLPPQRLARLPTASPTLRFIAPGKAPAEMAELIRVVERGDIPPDLALGGQYSARLVLSVLRHIAIYWAEKPPLRKHQRHPVKSRLFVLHGLPTCSKVFKGASANLADSAETWVVDNVSLGGFGALVANQREEWLRIGVLLGVQPEGGDNWLLGIVRRYGRENDSQAGVGIQIIAKQAQTIALRPRGHTSYSTPAGLTGILCRSGDETEMLQLVLPLHTFDVRETVDTEIDGQAVLLLPVDLAETGPDYEIGRYRMRLAE